MQKDTMSVHSAYRDAKGVLGRITNVLTSDAPTPENSKGMKSQLYSLDGYAPMLDGSPLTPTIIGLDGLVRFHNYNNVADEMKKLSEFECQSLYGETIQKAMQDAVHSTETLGEFLENTTLKCGAVRVFRQDFALEDAIGSHACSLEASMRVDHSHSSRVSTAAHHYHHKSCRNAQRQSLPGHKFLASTCRCCQSDSAEQRNV